MRGEQASWLTRLSDDPGLPYITAKGACLHGELSSDLDLTGPTAVAVSGEPGVASLKDSDADSNL